MATEVGTAKIVKSQTLTATSNEETSERFEPKRACRILNSSAASVTFTIYEENPITQQMLLCSDIAEVTIPARASVDLGPLVFACHRIACKLNAGTAELHVVTAE